MDGWECYPKMIYGQGDYTIRTEVCGLWTPILRWSFKDNIIMSTLMKIHFTILKYKNETNVSRSGGGCLPNE